MIRRMALKPPHEKGFDKALLREMMAVPAMPMTGLDPAKYPEDLIVACTVVMRRPLGHRRRRPQPTPDDGFEIRRIRNTYCSP